MIDEKVNRNIYVYDIETLASCFTYTAINVDTEEIVQYVIHKDRNDSVEFIKHLNECNGQIGFNNINFDYPVIHKILCNTPVDTLDIVKLAYDEAKRIIEEQSKEKFNPAIFIKQADIKIPQLDLFRMWHYNNKARATSLKSLEISMNYPNVMEMPILHDRHNITIEDVAQVLAYNLNDVLATYEFYKKSKDKISLRVSLTDKFNIPCINWSDSKIGEQLILKLYSDKMNLNQYDVKQLRTHRPSIALNDCILSYIKFDNDKFSKLLNNLKSKVIKETKGSIEESVIHKGFKYDYGTGGIHGCIKAGIYESDKDYIIIDADVASLYPSLAITNNFYPEHLGEDFIDVYKSIIDMRIEAKKAKNMVLSDGFKLAANSVYGKSNDINSFLFDPKFTMCITLNGQLLLTMLAEKITEIPDLTVLQINTDGITVKMPNTVKAKKMYDDICNEWQIKTKLQLEYVEYSKMIIADVNNYIAVKTDGKCKYKGRFEVDKVVGSEPAYHKDNSFRIIPLALSDYFVKKIPVEQTIKNHKNIYDFCGRQKFTSDSYGVIHHIGVNENNIPIQISEKQQKNVRYYISVKGSTFIKYYTKNASEFINKGYQVTIFNNFIEKDDYDINYEFYIRECYKEINNIVNKQLELF